MEARSDPLSMQFRGFKLRKGSLGLIGPFFTGYIEPADRRQSDPFLRPQNVEMMVKNDQEKNCVRRRVLERMILLKNYA